jgi:hypothetical protein
LLFVPFVWAKALENAPVANSATARPARQKKPAIKMRRLKKADCEVDFFSWMIHDCGTELGSGDADYNETLETPMRFIV